MAEYFQIPLTFFDPPRFLLTLLVFFKHSPRVTWRPLVLATCFNTRRLFLKLKGFSFLFGCEMEPRRSVAAVGASPECAFDESLQRVFPCVLEAEQDTGAVRKNVT